MRKIEDGAIDIQPPPLCRSYTVFEEFAHAAADWDLDFRQLGPMEKPYWLEQAVTGQMILNRAVLYSRFHQRGGSPRGFRTFTFLATGSREFRWCGELITSNTLLVMPENGEFESFSPPGLDTYHISMPVTLLESIAADCFDCTLDDLLGPGRALSTRGGDSLVQLRRLMHDFSDGLLGGDAGFLSPQREERVAFLALSILAEGGRVVPRGPRSSRMLALHKAIELLEERGRVSVPELAAEVGVSRRTLENAFQDEFSVSPAAYIKAQRLQLLRRDLAGSRPHCTSVGRLAKIHGFRHGGQLAADYRRLFGERPSATLRR